MKITIEGDPKEIADLVLELQDRQEEVPVNDLVDAIIGRLQDLQQQACQKCINAVIPPEGTMHTLTEDEMPHLIIGWKLDEPSSHQLGREECTPNAENQTES